MKNSSKPSSSFKKLLALSWRRKWLLGEAFLVLAVYKGLLLLLPFSFFVKKDDQTIDSTLAMDESYLEAVVWAISVVSNQIPLGFTCLVQALAAKWFLKKYPHVRLRIGVHKSATQAFSAHAWIVYKDRVVLGEQATQVFQPILEWK